MVFLSILACVHTNQQLKYHITLLLNSFWEKFMTGIVLRPKIYSMWLNVKKSWRKYETGFS